MKVCKKSIKFLTKSEALDILSSTGHEPRSKFIESVLSYCKGSVDGTRALEIKETLLGIGLTEFEAIQLIDCSPRSFLCLQLVIEEMEDRFSDEDLTKILGLFKDE